MAHRVVDRLEIVEVEEEHGDPSFGVLLQRMIQVDPEGGPVRQVRQRVVKGLMGELVFECLSLADVARIQDQTTHRRQLQ